MVFQKEKFSGRQRVHYYYSPLFPPYPLPLFLEYFDETKIFIDSGSMGVYLNSELSAKF